ncbi:murein hydrolase activator EnvC family protein [Helicobacter pylori]|uniref:murein hydrolase activator EnvC family protein n=1 Tax=Helicobacter pylori TaxID=210 RepID=UPI00287B6328|nr:peptidoglycan DD-metalloendopeptidase family protein [Helicobacter pylori]WNE31912.1 peptidoglycan DD-metalloendopeptidase family protein [Helicobacter pylori]WNE33336.1 peptidoglycan DD-metalloendopeptidase family protein [Helicobacter pylori]WNE34764.1 peptidoglycan DD-metalloendopeptidase family protein [Helicobacter pylori]WNE36187.1 peptidoglycan DD-metalloendopeptidase family protein [Helicobacter pylori]WNE37616.1 peptidoglycan DD-metalloendopeptidase family protein [Helicobacter pyl
MHKLGVFLLATLLSANTQKVSDIAKDIQHKETLLKKTHEEKNQLNSRLSSLGEAIRSKELQKAEMERQMIALKKSLEKNRNESLAQEKVLTNYRKSLDHLQKQRSFLQKRVFDTLLKDFLFSQALKGQNLASSNDVVLQVAFENLHQSTLSKMSQLSQEEKELNTQALKVKSSIQKISSVIDEQKTREVTLKSLKTEQDKLILSMQKDYAIYNQRLTLLEKERQNLNALLKRLNIIKQNRENEERVSLKKSSQALEVKQVASSYQNINTTSYNGPKTIAPLNDYEVVQKFGPYIDPVYNLKIFSESITLVSKTPNALVRNVLDGKIVFAKEINMLKKVVIIEHKNGIRTIYSQLDKIAPTIKSGMRIQKGYVLGRIDQRLGFEVTMREKHINPLELIARN